MPIPFEHYHAFHTRLDNGRSEPCASFAMAFASMTENARVTAISMDIHGGQVVLTREGTWFSVIYNK